MPRKRPQTHSSFSAGLLKQLGVYGRLMRLDRPIGIWLLLWPTLWGLWIAGEGRPDPDIFLVFVLGVIIMRSAGCVLNDFADRDIDGKVARTRDRPLVTREVAPAEALILFIALSLLAVALVLTLNMLTKMLAIGGALLTIIYPFAKRFIATPQLILGAAFGWSIPMAFAAQTGVIPRIAWLMWLTVVVWAVMYDTMYAMADRDEDLLAGVKSTAILFGNADVFIISMLQIVLVFSLVLVGVDAGMGSWYMGSLVAGSAFLVYQHRLIRSREPEQCFRAFLNNHYFGAAVFAGILLDFVFRTT